MNGLYGSGKKKTLNPIRDSISKNIKVIMMHLK